MSIKCTRSTTTSRLRPRTTDDDDNGLADMWQENYGGPSSQQPYYQQPQPPQTVPLQFYQSQDGFYGGSRPSLDGNVIPQGSISSQPMQSYGGNIQPAGSWLSAFGTGGFEGEPPLLEGVCAAAVTHHQYPHSTPQSSESIFHI